MQVIMVANFVPVKGHVTLVRALQRLIRRRSLDCLLVGAGETEPAIRRLVQQDGLSQVVQFLGTRTDVPAILRQSDVCVVPSYWEGFGNVVLEAMAVGTPVVATRVGGIPEIISDGNTGLLVSPADPGALAGAIERLLDNLNLRERIRINAHRRVAEYFDVQRMVAQYEAWYAGLLARQGRMDESLAPRPFDAGNACADGRRSP